MAFTSAKLSRRKFLLAVGAGGAATVAAVAAKTQGQAALPSTTGTGKRATKGYAASEHINNYYRTTKV